MNVFFDIFKNFAKCEWADKSSVLSSSIIALVSYMCLHLSSVNVFDLKVYVLLFWFLALHIISFNALSMSLRYRSNKFEEALFYFKDMGFALFMSKSVLLFLKVVFPLSLLLFLMFLQGVFAGFDFAYIAFLLLFKAMGLVALVLLCQMLCYALMRVESVSFALPLLFFPLALPGVIYLYASSLKVLELSLNNPLVSVLGFIFILLSLSYIVFHIGFEDGA